MPTLRHLRMLERVDEKAPSRGKSWGIRQGLIFLGTTLIVVAVGCFIFLQFRRPLRITDPLVKSNTNKMTPAELWKFWPILEQGIQRRLFATEAVVLERNRFDIQSWNEWRLTSVVVAGVGVLIVAIGLFLIPTKQRRRPVR